MNRHRVFFGVAGLALAGALALVAADLAAKLPPPSDKKGLTYEKDIKPIFEKSCIECHGPDKQKGRVRLDSLEATLKSGKGKAVVPGKSEESLLVLSVARVTEDPDHHMPPEGKGEPLSKEQVGLIRAWIDQGAK
ncbi:hypothetical protein NXS98_06915 [Fontisphaera persica]|uniref:c-type cytochrome domain-containing protein n=1 Tax=Fontisphaera persica TaxID=2974023 RepID=UPI0024BFF274|nr:c-type cytochrome domain-containing protein [Fontisphaera persica]WCJ60854.1 hypothetical protein NXS98_06915 [Fontisphaera persica]